MFYHFPGSAIYECTRWTCFVCALLSSSQVEWIRFNRKQKVYIIINRISFPTQTENKDVWGLTLALRSLNQRSQCQSGDIGASTGSAAKQQYFPFSLFTGCRSLCAASTMNRPHWTFHIPPNTYILSFLSVTNLTVGHSSLNGLTMPILLHGALQGAGCSYSMFECKCMKTAGQSYCVAQKLTW